MNQRPSLPVQEVLAQLQRTLQEVGCAILQAPPGAGKTTTVPLALVGAPWLGGRKIVVLEPRRIAARAAARYMAAQLGERVGETVGFRVRLESRVGPRTRIEVVTEGVFTRLLQDDPGLEQVGLVIFDEFHERSLQADLGLALCLDSRAALRPDLRLLIMSATLQLGPLQALLPQAPLIVSEGRSFPVAVHHRPLPVRFNRDRTAFVAEVARLVMAVITEEAGSALVFLPGVGEIRRAAEILAAQLHGSDVLVAPLYGDLSAADQDRAIAPAPPGLRKVVLATSIAETSLTIEGIRIVVDSGLMRRPRFEPRTGFTRLHTERVSQAAAVQRCGRAGRLEPGACYRLWSATEHSGLVPFHRPEMLEADLSPLALDLALWGVSDPAELRWLDPPPAAAFAQAQDLLRALGALDAAARITAHGRAMAAFGVHPRLAHMLLRGQALGLGALAAELAALMEERDLLPAAASPDCDLRTRLELLRRSGIPAGVQRGTLHRVRQSAERYRRQLGAAAAGGDLDHAGLLLAFAYPDRIAMRRAEGHGRFLLANGGGARFAAMESLSGREFIVAAHLDGNAREARIFLAAAVARGDLLEHFAGQLVSESFVRWDEADAAVLCRRQRRLGRLVLDDAPLADPDPARVTAELLRGIRSRGLQCLSWGRPTRAWQARVRFLARHAPDQWPDVSDEALLDNLESWLAPYLAAMSRLEHLQRLDLQQALANLLDWSARRRLDELAPTHLSVPSGSRIALDYANDPPVLAVRLQEMFGLEETPRIAGGRVAVLLHLLSPAGRPVQVTQDLAGFWRSGYFEVRKDLRGRYPKHPWPDDPSAAQPTRRVKPRRR